MKMSKSSALAVSEIKPGKYEQILEYLQEDCGYWLKNDIWNFRVAVFKELSVELYDGNSGKMNFSGFVDDTLKNEAKFYIAYSLKNKTLSASTVCKLYKKPMEYLSQYFARYQKAQSFADVKINKQQAELFFNNAGEPRNGQNACYALWNGLVSFITKHYDEREETEKDIWYAVNIPCAKSSAAEKSGCSLRLSFTDIPGYYRETVKRFYRRLVTKRSWSYCSEILTYVKQFFEMFYSHGYADGFFERLSREDIEKYLLWAADCHKEHNATYRSKAVSYVRHFIDYIQLAEYPQAPIKDVNKLIYDDDYPRRERTSDTLAKVKYIPAPVIEQLDAAVYEMESKEFVPVYILLRESGWRGTDVLNLRYDNCIDYQWNAKERKYIGYLCGEITKTGIPQLKIPIRDEVAELVKELADAAAKMSTAENNPDRFLFNVYEGRQKGRPLRKAKFAKIVNKLIKQKGIKNAEGDLYHFKTHSMRHTRAVEYTEQGMPIGIVQQLLGHCSLQMTLHYAKVSENVLYEKWKETESAGLFHIDGGFADKSNADGGNVCYENIRSNLDAVRVPFGACFKPTKVSCRQQTQHCLECPNFCSTQENIPEYEAEIQRVTEMIRISADLGRVGWAEKNREYLTELETVLKRIQTEGTVHKNGAHREER